MAIPTKVQSVIDVIGNAWAVSAEEHGLTEIAEIFLESMQGAFDEAYKDTPSETDGELV